MLAVSSAPRQHTFCFFVFLDSFYVSFRSFSFCSAFCVLFSLIDSLLVEMSDRKLRGCRRKCDFCVPASSQTYIDVVVHVT